MVALLYATKTKVSSILFQDSLSISRGLNPPSGWGFNKPEVQIPTLPPICPTRGGGGGGGGGVTLIGALDAHTVHVAN